MADVLWGISQSSQLDWEYYRLNGFVDKTISFADIEVINPRKDLFEHFITSYKEEFDCGYTEENLSNKKDKESDVNVDMHELANRPKVLGNVDNPSELINMVSVSMLIRCGAFSLLALGDSFPQEIYKSLVERGYSKMNKLYVDYLSSR